jgi:anti-sigma regulatory factor (Ser/Thr protein kinase)
MPDPVEPESWPEGGFGWAMVRRLTCDLSYESAGGRNRLRFAVSAGAPVGIG